MRVDSIRTATGDTPPALRERKKAATSLALPEAALELCVRDGYVGLTVDAICLWANASRRTFSNYFAERDEAIICWSSEDHAALTSAIVARPADEDPMTHGSSTRRRLARRSAPWFAAAQHTSMVTDAAAHCVSTRACGRSRSSHVRRCLGVVLVHTCIRALGALEIRQYRIDGEPPRQPRHHPRARATTPARARPDQPSLPAQCSAWRRSTAASWFRICRRWPCAASARPLYTSARRRSAASNSRNRLAGLRSHRDNARIHTDNSGVVWNHSRIEFVVRDAPGVSGLTVRGLRGRCRRGLVQRCNTEVGVIALRCGPPWAVDFAAQRGVTTAASLRTVGGAGHQQAADVAGNCRRRCGEQCCVLLHLWGHRCVASLIVGMSPAARRLSVESGGRVGS